VIMHLVPISYNYLLNKSNAERSLMYLSIQLLNLGTHHYLNSADKNLWAVTWELLTLVMIFFDYLYIYKIKISRQYTSGVRRFVGMD
jgi:hypothetical protein